MPDRPLINTILARHGQTIGCNPKPADRVISSVIEQRKFLDAVARLVVDCDRKDIALNHAAELIKAQDDKLREFDELQKTQGVEAMSIGENNEN
jgi:hypothetical protein